MDPRMIPKGGSDREFTDLENRHNPNEAGVYYHPIANKFIETAGQKRPDGSMAYVKTAGSIQGDAFAQIGYKPADKEQLEAYRAQQKDQEKLNRIEASRTTMVVASK